MPPRAPLRRGSGRPNDSGGNGWTELEVWLLKLGVVVIHGRPFHPQTQGKDERFHRTLKAELLRPADLRHVAHAQSLMDPWRDVYNPERPHEAVGLKPPASRYRPSERAMPEHPADYEPSPGHFPVTVREGGRVRYAGRRWHIGEPWDRHTVGLVPDRPDGLTDVYYGPYLIARLDPRLARVRDGLVPVGRCAPSLHVPELNKERHPVARGPCSLHRIRCYQPQRARQE